MVLFRLMKKGGGGGGTAIERQTWQNRLIDCKELNSIAAEVMSCQFSVTEGVNEFSFFVLLSRQKERKRDNEDEGE